MRGSASGSSAVSRQAGLVLTMLFLWLVRTVLSPGGRSFTRGRPGAGGQVTLRCPKCKRETTYTARPSDDDDSAWICKNRHRPKRRKEV
jgi:hypothetical protein